VPCVKNHLGSSYSIVDIIYWRTQWRVNLVSERSCGLSLYSQEEDCSRFAILSTQAWKDSDRIGLELQYIVLCLGFASNSPCCSLLLSPPHHSSQPCSHMGSTVHRIHHLLATYSSYIAYTWHIHRITPLPAPLFAPALPIMLDFPLKKGEDVLFFNIVVIVHDMYMIHKANLLFPAVQPVRRNKSLETSDRSVHAIAAR